MVFPVTLLRVLTLQSLKRPQNPDHPHCSLATPHFSLLRVLTSQSVHNQQNPDPTPHSSESSFLKQIRVIRIRGVRALRRKGFGDFENLEHRNDCDSVTVRPCGRVTVTI